MSNIEKTDIEGNSATTLMRISGKYDTLPMKYKPIVFLAVADFLPDRARGGTGKHLLKLMHRKDAEKNEKNGTINYNEDEMITNVAEETFFVMNCLYGTNDIKNDTMSGIRKMFTQRGITEDNNYVDWLSDYFSVSPSVITNGIGVRYHKDKRVITKQIGKNINIDVVLTQYLQEKVAENCAESSDSKKEEIVERLKTILDYSDCLYVDTLIKALKIKSTFYDLVFEEDVFLCFDSGYLMTYASRLNEKQLVMIEHLLNNIYKFVLNMEIGTNGYPKQKNDVEE